jgi:hypothetical protein
MWEYIKNYWDEALALLSFAISIISIVLSYIQNKRLHDDNKKLSCLPILDVEIHLHDRIRGQIVKKTYAIDEFNVWETKYTPYYTHRDLGFGNATNVLFTVLVKNIGNGPAKNIIYKTIKVYCGDSEFLHTSSEILFSCNKDEIKANVIAMDVFSEEVDKVEIVFQYTDILGVNHTLNNTYKPKNDKQSEMQLLNSVEK